MRLRLQQFVVKHHLGLILLLAFLLRLPLLNGSFWLDESAQFLESIRPFSQQLNIAYDFQPPLFHLIMHFWLQFSHAEWWARLIPVLCGLVTIWATYQIGKKLLNWQAGALASLLLATSSFHIYFSQELRPYSLAAMFGMLSWVVLVHWKMEKSEKGSILSTNFPILLFSLLTALGLYSMYLYPFLLFSQLVYVFAFKREIIKPVILSTTFASLTFLPWLPKFLEQLQVGSQLRQNTIGWENVVSFPQLKALPLTFGKFVFGVVDLDVNLYYLFATLGLIVGIAFLIKKITWKKTSELLPISVVGLGLPVLTAWFVSFVVPVLQPKRVLFCLPFVYLGFAWIIQQALIKKDQTKQRTVQFLITLLFLINSFGTLQYFSNPLYQRENWRELIAIIDQNYSPSDTAVVFSFDEPFAPWFIYNEVPFTVFKTGTATVQSIDQVRDTLTPALRYETIIVFDYLRDLTDPQRFTEQWLSQYNYQQAELYEYPGIGFVRVFRRSKVIGSR